MKEKATKSTRSSLKKEEQRCVYTTPTQKSGADPHKKSPNRVEKKKHRGRN